MRATRHARRASKRRALPPHRTAAIVPRVLIDTAVIPGGGELRLFRRGDDFTIVLGGNALMGSRLSGSEALLATMACARMPATPAPRLLIGGLGMGFTLRAALAVLPAEAAVTVIELVPAVVAWARGPLAPVFAGCLDDPRVEMIVGDVGDAIAAADRGYDAILLDVDNGPDGLSRTTNNRLYAASGLAAARRALKPDGVLAIWSAAPDAAFTRRLAAAGFAVEETTVRANAGRGGARHVIWLAVRRG